MVGHGRETYVAATHFEDCSGKLLVICGEEVLTFDGPRDADVAVDGRLGGEAGTAVGEKILGRRREGIGPETFWSGRILEAPCPSPLRLQGALGHWTLADRRVSTLPSSSEVGKPQGAHGPQLIPWVGSSGLPREGGTKGPHSLSGCRKEAPRAQERKGGDPDDRLRPQPQSQP